MLYYLFEYLNKLDFPGAGVFQYISFRAVMAVMCSLIISMVFGKRLIAILRRKQVGETVRDLGLEGQKEKEGTPTMGGLIILAAILIPTLLFAKLDNIYIITMIIATVWLGLVGFMDDYIKVFKKNKKGLAGKFKIVGQVGVSAIIALILYFGEDVKVRDYGHIYTYEINAQGEPTGKPIAIIDAQDSVITGGGFLMKNKFYTHDVKSTTTTIPFVKNNEFDYSWILGQNSSKWGWLVFVIVVVIIITAVSNGANMTDGIDGLATGTSAIIGLTLAIFAYISGNFILADYLNIMYIPHSSELVIFISAFVGACIGFLWYNSYPAQVFMGDTGSLALGGIIAVFSIAIRKELLIPLLCGIFLIENLSVMLQVSYFKYTRKKYGEGRRIFKMAPLHHHYQVGGMHESKIVSRFWIMGILLAVITIATLKLR